MPCFGLLDPVWAGGSALGISWTHARRTSKANWSSCIILQRVISSLAVCHKLRSMENCRSTCWTATTGTNPPNPLKWLVKLWLSLAYILLHHKVNHSCLQFEVLLNLPSAQIHSPLLTILQNVRTSSTTRSQLDWQCWSLHVDSDHYFSLPPVDIYHY